MTWESMWANGLQPGQAFDAAKPETALLALIPGSGVQGLQSSPPLDLAGKSALVPGCGRGYALAALSKGGCARVHGLEISQTAVTRANEYLKGVGVGKEVTVADGDFFAHAETYDVVYDCTFLCAIPPERREEWAVKMAQLIRPGGVLVTLIFPVREGVEPADGQIGGGPPFAMSPKLVEKLLAPKGVFKKTSLEKV
eukprot:CAMPEP_0173379324 /NCGR_PEP_ID=MMETSP1356-20130122/2320_1 /TAXON_ID=77927 ORGANISM="Hemiselmis virescens, Strain PCC157" /NCGR_SAMPLE_ID=MMETSP1356 /ASSEMBLY_ACC=CAM_ASM_000847 /LENGTH=196 /DNA_ID=CAMNT_0014332641 /DNA_START=420 /DNA_END=1007 /DNA_ORIENTATION=+